MEKTQAIKMKIVTYAKVKTQQWNNVSPKIACVTKSKNLPIESPKLNNSSWTELKIEYYDKLFFP